jgi:endonuclease YncB( thermonuclease family)
LPQILDPKVNTPNPPVTQTITGQASVIDGDPIEIHGTRIRLFGIDAPESSQTCTTGEGKEYRCGQHAALALAAKIKAQTVECQPKTNDRHGRDVAKCLVGGEDLSAWMVAQGWALAYRYFSTDYVREEERASRLKLGMWQGKFEAPWDWRRNHRGRASTPPPSSRARSAVYYRPGDLSGTRYLTMTDCEQARQRAGNVGVCVMK